MSRVGSLELVREIGRGTYGSVWLVRWTGTARNLVLKCVDLKHCSSSEVESARQEVHILAGLKHPNIVSYKGSFEVGGELNLLMGYCAGGDLATLIRRQRGRLFSEVQIVRWLIQITMALQYLHSHHILHRDLKTQNIFLTRAGLIKVGDFGGISRILGSPHDMATTLVGTPYYMEQDPWEGNETACEVSAFLRYINAIAEWTTLGLMALERTILLLIVFSQYMKEVPTPLPSYDKDQGGFTISWIYVFKLFPVLLAVIISWCLCAILTVTQVLPEDSKARTDLSIHVIKESPWFRFPYPGQWGMPTVSVAGTLGMMAGVIASMIESVGDYYACARIAGAPPPPVHAINRGIGIEGIGCILAGLWGSGNGTTSSSENIGAIGVTKVGSRRVVQVAAVIMMLFGVFGKFGSAMVTIPEPVVGGMFIVMFSIITAVGLSTLQFVNLSSSRNIFIVGFSIFFGLALPKWLQSNSESIQTGSETLDQILIVLLQTSMLVGGILGFVLDNTIPGTPEERGLVAWNNQTALSSSTHEDGIKSTCYDIPFVTQSSLNNNRMFWTKYLPFCPNFDGFCRRKRKSEV